MHDLSRCVFETRRSERTEWRVGNDREFQRARSGLAFPKTRSIAHSREPRDSPTPHFCVKSPTEVYTSRQLSSGRGARDRVLVTETAKKRAVEMSVREFRGMLPGCTCVLRRPDDISPTHTHRGAVLCDSGTASDVPIGDASSGSRKRERERDS